MSETHVSRVGIVDAVQAKRKNSEVSSLGVTVRFETMLVNEYSYSDETKIDEVTFHVPPGEGVNPGDVVVMSLNFKSPFGQRFVPALEAAEAMTEEPVEEVETYEVPDDDEDESNGGHSFNGVTEDVDA